MCGTRFWHRPLWNCFFFFTNFYHFSLNNLGELGTFLFYSSTKHINFPSIKQLEQQLERHKLCFMNKQRGSGMYLLCALVTRKQTAAGIHRLGKAEMEFWGVTLVGPINFLRIALTDTAKWVGYLQHNERLIFSVVSLYIRCMCSLIWEQHCSRLQRVLWGINQKIRQREDWW